MNKLKKVTYCLLLLAMLSLTGCANKYETFTLPVPAPGTQTPTEMVK